jgi:ADP-heptose:LPS heptosyltransferase
MRILVIRTSAMGDIALITPVLAGMRRHYREVEIVVLTRAAFEPFFSSMNGVRLFLPDFKNRHSGLPGLIRLFRDLKGEGEFDHIIDLHDVLRSKFLRLLFILSGVAVSVIDKGRSEKRAVIKGKIRSALKHSVERYFDVFDKAGFKVPAVDGPWIIPSAEALTRTAQRTGEGGCINIGVAPYAKHNLKRWPEDYMKRLLVLISEKHAAKFWLFGGKEESERLEVLSSEIKGSFNTAGKLNLDEELALISRLDFMIAMDSSNMHMAALTGTRVISIWGGTDPVTGFGPWQQPCELAMRIPAEELSCRPCTVYGKGECRRGDFACMMWLTPEKVLGKMLNLKII